VGPAGRKRPLIFPREHGAWGILLVPLITGAAAGLRNGGMAALLAPFTVAVLALFWLRTPVESWIGSTPIKARSSEDIRLVRIVSLLLAAIAAAALSAVFWTGQHGKLVWIGALAAGAFLGQGVIRQIWKKARTAAQMVGAAGLTSVAPAAYYLVTGNLNWTAWSLWILNFLFAANQIQFVQLRIHAAQAKTRKERYSAGFGFLIMQTAQIGLLIAAGWTHVTGWKPAIAFLPVFWRGFRWYVAPFEPLVVRRLGKQELAQAIGFGILLILATA